MATHENNLYSAKAKPVTRTKWLLRTVTNSKSTRRNLSKTSVSNICTPQNQNTLSEQNDGYARKQTLKNTSRNLTNKKRLIYLHPTKSKPATRTKWLLRIVTSCKNTNSNLCKKSDPNIYTKLNQRPQTGQSYCSRDSKLWKNTSRNLCKKHLEYLYSTKSKIFTRAKWLLRTVTNSEKYK